MVKLKRSKFNLSHENKLTCNMGQLVPVMTELALPGDKWKCRINAVMRVAPLLAPLMHNVKLYFHTFSVPLRLLMNEKEWESFITGGVDNNDTSVLPTITFADGINVGELGDYLGFPTNTPATGTSPAVTLSGLTVSALPFRAYALIYNEWFRNQNLQEELPLSLEMGSDITTNTTLQHRNWKKDYFNGNLPFQQRGPNIILPLGESAPVVGNGNALLLTNGTYNGYIIGANDAGESTNTANAVEWGGSGSTIIPTTPTTIGTTLDRVIVPSSQNHKALGYTDQRHLSGLEADLSANSAGANFSDFLSANAIYQFALKQARGGARYVETLMSQFGVRSSDARLQRPEFIGGGVSQLVVTPVLQTSSSDTVSPQGNMAGQAFSAQRSRQFSHFFEEHCVVMTLMSIMPDTSYQQGIRRQWMYRTRYDFPFPVFSHMPEQATYLGELYATGDNTANYSTFGFNPRYQECRRIPSSVHGEFRTTLNYWHMGRIFDNAPALNSTFITSNPTKRINAVTTEDNCWCDVGFEITALRPLPKQGHPNLKTSI